MRLPGTLITATRAAPRKLMSEVSEQIANSSTLLSMLLSLGVYWTAWGWKYALDQG